MDSDKNRGIFIETRFKYYQHIICHKNSLKRNLNGKTNLRFCNYGSILKYVNVN